MALLALLASVLWGTGDYLGGLVTRRRPVLVVVLAVQTIGAVVVGAASVAAGSAGLGDSVWFGVAAGAAGAVALAAFYAALAVGTMGVVAPIAATGIVLPCVVSWVRGDRPAVGAGVGIVLAAAGIVLSSGVDVRSGAPRRAPALAALAAAGFGSVLVLVDAAAASSATTLGVLLTMRTTAALILASVLLARRTRPTVGRADAPALVGAALCDVSAVGLYAVATGSDAPLAVVAVLASLYPVVTALLARHLLAERLSRAQVAGVITALTGVVLIAASGSTG